MTSTRSRSAALVLGAMVAGGAIAAGLYAYLQPPATATAAAAADAAAADAAAADAAPAGTAPAGRRVLFWYDPMFPNTRFDKPGKSPFMDMDLLPRYADEDGAEGAAAGVRIDPTQTQNLGLRTEPVRRGMLTYRQTLPANVGYNEYQFVIVQARSAGFIERVYPLTVGDRIARGTPLAELTIPEWVEAQSEYLLLRRTGGAAADARGLLERLRLAGMPEEDLQRLVASRTVQTRFTLKAPIDGVITAFDLRTGMNVAKSSVVARIQGVDPVWITAAVPESIAGLLHDGAGLDVSVPAWPGRPFKVERWTLLPSMDAATRTLQLRLQVDNPDEALKPGMNAYVEVSARSAPLLLIPSTALIDTGAEQRVITVDAAGHFVPKRVEVTQESGGLTAIGAGLAEGEKVVSNGLFLIDSEANIAGALERMRARPPQAAPAH